MPPYYDVKGLRDRAAPIDVDGEHIVPQERRDNHRPPDRDVRDQLLADALDKERDDIHQVVDGEADARNSIFIFTYDGYIWLIPDQYRRDDIMGYENPGAGTEAGEYVGAMLERARGFDTRTRATIYVRNSRSFKRYGELWDDAEAVINDLDA